MKGLAGLFGLFVAMSAAARQAEDRVRERTERVQRALQMPPPAMFGVIGRRHRQTRYTTVNTAQEQARRLRQRAQLEAKLALRVA